MPLSQATINSNFNFSFLSPVTNWQSLESNSNQVLFGGTIDTNTWDEAYATVLTLASSGSSTFDLSSFTNLARESTGLTAVVAMAVQVTPQTTGNTNISVTVKPAASNGFVWFAGSTDGIKLIANEQFLYMGDLTGSGITVDSTHKNVTISNSGTHTALVRVAVLGTS